MKFFKVISLSCFGSLCLADTSDRALEEKTVAASTGCTELSPKPKQYICGDRGEIKRGHEPFSFVEAHSFAADKEVPNFNACRDLCINRKAPKGHGNINFRCQTFAFDSKRKLCSFYTRPVNKVFKADKKSTVAYWDVSCFKCPPVSCPQARNINLIDNGGFEDSNTLLGPFSNVYVAQPVQGQIEHPGHNSKNAWKCRGEFCTLYQWRTLCPGYLYTLSFDYKIDKGPKSSVYTTVGDAFYAADYGTEGTAGKWKHVDMTFENVFELELVQIDWFNSCSGCAYYLHVDNIKVLPHYGSYETIPGSEVKWPNYNFESGKLSPWVFSRYYGKGNHSIVSPGLAGSKYAFKYIGNNTVNYDNFQLDFALPALIRDVEYVLKFDYKVTGNVEINPAIGGSSWDPSGDVGLGYVNYTFELPQNKLLRYERLFTVSSPGQQNFSIGIIKPNLGKKGPYPETVILDNFSIARAAI